MNETTIQHIASRVRGLGRELLAIANELDAQAPHLSAQIPDLFTQMGLTTDNTMEQVDALVDIRQDEPVRRHYQRNGKRMVEHLAVASSDKLGRKQGFCNRGDIERSLVRITGRSREDVREAVNRVAARMQITCIKSHSYRYYPCSLRPMIINEAARELQRI